MEKGWLIEALRAALTQVPGYENLPENTFPTLPIVQATGYGQQHVVVTFAPGPPPPAVLVPKGEFSPAVTLHIIWPGGYSYWQPETGTAQYIGAAQAVADLPETYHQILREYSQHYLARPSRVRKEPQLRHYLQLVEEVLANEWLLQKNPAPEAEKAVATQLRAHLQQLCEPKYEAYYRARGQALYEWLERATYEKSWVEEALDLAHTTAPTWAQPADGAAFAVRATAPMPAVLDGRGCILVAFCWVSKGPADAPELVYPPFAACYVAYPDKEVYWRQFGPGEYFDLLSCGRDQAGRAYLGLSKPRPITEPEALAATRTYYRLVSVLLERAWLETRYPPTGEEVRVARALQECVRVLYAPPLAAYYQHKAWQLLAWLARVTESASTAGLG